MSSQYHAIIFYTVHPDDKISQEILVELQRYPELKNQIKLICVSNPNLTLPKMIVELDTFPIIITRGIDQPLMGEHALTWIKEGHFSGKTTAENFADVQKAQKIDDEFGTLSSKTEYHSAEDWNQDGVDQTSHVVNSTFSNISETQNVETFMEGDSKGGSQMDREMRRLQMLRDQDVPPPSRPGTQAFSQKPESTRGSAMPLPTGPPTFPHPLANPRPPPYGGFPMQQQSPKPNQNQNPCL